MILEISPLMDLCTILRLFWRITFHVGDYELPISRYPLSLLDRMTGLFGRVWLARRIHGSARARGRGMCGVGFASLCGPKRELPPAARSRLFSEQMNREHELCLVIGALSPFGRCLPWTVTCLSLRAHLKYDILCDASHKVLRMAFGVVFILSSRRKL